MREIKFRGKEKCSGLWRCGFLLFDGEKYYIIQTIQGTLVKWIVDTNTIGQFTGLTDKNEKPIYEGDIVALPSQDIAFGIVTWHDNGYFFIDTSDGEWRSFGNDFRTLGEFMNLGDDHKIKVIGNIHDNFDLMK